MIPGERRYDLDWIRVIVFDILILYHVGMFFVPWGWHIKNNEIVDWVQWPMILVNQWRIPILFVVSGMGTRFALSYRSGGEYIRERLKRLFIPLLVGVLLIVPPQVYLERVVNGEFDGSFFDFLPHIFDGIYPTGNFSWHHLWFLPYLLLFSVVFTRLFIWLRKDENPWIAYLRKKIHQSPYFLILFFAPLFVIDIALEGSFKITHALIGDWFALALYGTLFVYGFILVSVGDIFWNAVIKIRYISLVCGLIALPSLVWLWFNWDPSFMIPVARTFNQWSWILAVFGFAARYLNRSSKTLKYRNQAVYPFYILHQTLTIILGYWVMDFDWHYGMKFIVMAIGTFGGCWVLYELVIRRIAILRPLFGLKKR